MQQRQVLITGGGGFLGKVLARKCVQRGDKVFSFSRTSRTELSVLGVIQIIGDVTDKSAVAAAARGMDVVFHLAARTGNWGRLGPFYKTNVKGTRNVIEACRGSQVKVLVYTSTTRVMMEGRKVFPGTGSADYPRRFSDNYAMSRAFAEQAVRKAADENLRTVILRPHMIWGPGDTSTVPGIFKKRRPLFRIGNGKNKVSGIYVEDAAMAHLIAADRVLENPDLSGKAYVIAQGEPLVLWDFIDSIRAMKGEAPVRFRLPKRMAYRIGSVLEFFHKHLGLPFGPVITRTMVRELAFSHVFDNGPFQKDLGFEPSVSLDQGMASYKRWLMAPNPEKKWMNGD